MNPVFNERWFGALCVLVFKKFFLKTMTFYSDSNRFLFALPYSELVKKQLFIKVKNDRHFLPSEEKFLGQVWPLSFLKQLIFQFWSVNVRTRTLLRHSPLPAVCMNVSVRFHDWKFNCIGLIWLYLMSFCNLDTYWLGKCWR